MNNKYLIITRSSLIIIYLSFIALLNFTACTVKLISYYDEFTDEGVAELQKSVESLLSDINRSIGTEDYSYQNFETDYDNIRIELAALQVRANARPKNEIQV